MRSDMEQRVGRLEREVRAYGFLVLFAILAFASGAVGEKGGNDTSVRAPFRVVDSRGRALLSVADGFEGSELELYDRLGREVVSFGVQGEGGKLLLSRAGEGLLYGGHSSDGGSLGIDNGRGFNVITLHTDALGHGVYLWAPGQNLRAALVGSALSLSGHDSFTRLELLGGPGAGRLSIFDAEGKKQVMSLP